MKIVKLNRLDFFKSPALVTGGLLLSFEAPVTAEVKIVLPHNSVRLYK